MDNVEIATHTTADTLAALRATMGEPRPGDHVEVTYRGVLVHRSGDFIDLRGPQGSVDLPPWGTVRVVDPPEPTEVNTVVTGWATPGDDRPESLYVFVLSGRDGDGDGAACWETPGSDHEYRWMEVLTYTASGRRIIPPAAG